MVTFPFSYLRIAKPGHRYDRSAARIRKESGFAVNCGGVDHKSWTVIATASEIEATQATLDSAVFEGKTAQAIGQIRLVGNTLQARCRPVPGFKLMIR